MRISSLQHSVNTKKFKGGKWMDKLIVTVAPSSNFHGKDANPALPYSPQEVADSVYECWGICSTYVFFLSVLPGLV